MGDQVVSGAVFGDEGPELGVLDGNLIDARPFVQDGLDFLVVRVGTQPFDACNFAGIEVFFQPLDQTIERRFGGVGDEAGHRAATGDYLENGRISKSLSVVGLKPETKLDPDSGKPFKS